MQVSWLRLPLRGCTNCAHSSCTAIFRALQYDAAAALTAVLDELDALGSEGARRVEVSLRGCCYRAPQRATTNTCCDTPAAVLGP